MTDKRPLPVTSLLFVVLCLSAWNAVRLGACIADWNTLAEFAPRPGPLYIAASASLWTFGGLAVWMAIRRREPRARWFAAVYFAAYALWYWLDRLLLQPPRPNWPFALAITVVLLAAAFGDILNQRTKEYFQQRETHEQTHTDPDPA